MDDSSMDLDKTLADDGAAEPFVVPPIFLDPAGDLILESSDGHRFQIFRAFLIFGSTFFRDMFSHPQPVQMPDEPLKWDESGDIISLILYHLHPIADRPVANWKQLVALAKAADKWGIDSVLTMARQELLKPAVFAVRPFVVYNVARDIDCKDFQVLVRRRLVAQHDPLNPDIRTGLEHMSALELCKLVDMRKRRSKNAQGLAKRSFPRLCAQHGAPWLGIQHGHGGTYDVFWDNADVDKLRDAAARWAVMPGGTPYSPDLVAMLKRTKDAKLCCEAGCVVKVKEVLSTMAKKFED